MTISEAMIRLLRKDDLPALEWDGEYKHFRRLYADIYQSMDSGKALMWGAELKYRGIIGQLFVQLNSGRTELADGSCRAYLYGFRIKPAYRRQGLGGRMLMEVERDLLKRHFQNITLNVAQDNPLARQFYERMGFQVVTSDPGRWFYYDHLGNRREVCEPAWRMEKTMQSEEVIVRG